MVQSFHMVNIQYNGSIHFPGYYLLFVGSIQYPGCYYFSVVHSDAVVSIGQFDSVK